MDASLINKNALYRQLIAKHGASSFTYMAVSNALDGDEETLSKERAKQLMTVIDEAVKAVKANIQKSIEFEPK